MAVDLSQKLQTQFCAVERQTVPVRDSRPVSAFLHGITHGKNCGDSLRNVGIAHVKRALILGKMRLRLILEAGFALRKIYPESQDFGELQVREFWFAQDDVSAKKRKIPQFLYSHDVRRY
ncbi:hypothetical protein [Shimia aestuarii]|uniref:hypothetical protein n=1 Tax=Shimia aestuarii TaxID=254406 RepID=UPI001FB52FB1|nr:hypothetical protein [Shimia aestuarii]